MPEFLLEIGVEEMPAAWLEGVATQLSTRFQEAVAREHLMPAPVPKGSDSAAVFWTPRRLVLRAEVSGRQPDREEPVWGPSLKVAKDAAGEWTNAARGFAKKNGVAVEDLRQGAKESGAPTEVYLLFVKRVAGRAAPEVLTSLVSAVLRSLTFPKRMSWDAWLEDGKGAFPFGRPIRWLLALLEGQVVPLAIYGRGGREMGPAVVESGRLTFGHRFLPRGAGGRPQEVRGFADLKEALRRSFVLLDPGERETRIREGLTAVGGPDPIADDHGLRQEWRDLVEYPTVVAGRIPSDFQALPTEVLQTVLVHHQKYIPLLARDGTVARFAAVTNTDGAAGAEIVRGLERVVVARLRDAAFFWAEDMKRPLADRVADLAGVTFHQGLGTYREKTERLVKLVYVMGGQLGYLSKPQLQAAQDAAQLAKADLTTAMVREFPELQGAMGGIYLRAQGHPWPNVASAVYWHYYPLSIEEGSPPAGHLAGSDATIFGAVSLADKLDTLAGYFGLGLVPTGSSDPFGLRRAGQGAVRVLLDFWHSDTAERRPSLTALVDAAVAGYAGVFERQPKEVVQALEGFLLDRLEYVLVARGFPAEEVAAVLYTPTVSALDDPHDCLVRLKALHRGRAEAQEDFEHLAVAFKRAKNILTQQAGSPVIEPGLFESDAERELHGAVTRLADADGGYEARLRALAGLRAPVDRFFDDVLVMAEDPKVRANRLALLHQALSLFYRIADISRLGG
ncbi:MAG TPA: glycine--tRNA ligase subunit beta [Vicinamibacteria bacterium]|nr:glycine--tRNA ligase subunit beta [Vicinamibacteria bacterium]